MPEVLSIKPGTPFELALRLKLAPGWHAYWKNPGDSGLPIRVNWDLPAGFRQGELQWPYPERFEVGPIMNFGYEGEVIFLNKIHPPREGGISPGGEAPLRAHLDILVCKDVCIPELLDLELKLPVAQEIPRADVAWTKRISDARARLPLKSSEWEIEARTDDENVLIRARPPRWDPDTAPLDFFPAEPELMDASAELVRRKVDGDFEIVFPKARDSREVPPRLRGVLFSERGFRGPRSEKALEVDIPIGREAILGTGEVRGAMGSRVSLGLALVFSFIGGLILNLMPCVLPVLSLKVLHFVQKAGDRQYRPLVHAAIYTLGILVSFWILAGVLVVLKSLGHALGWGFQLQSPVFLIVLSGIFFLFGLNLFGVFEVGQALTGVGGRMRREGFFGSFLTGVLATVVATPCTAPFMGAAIGFAITQPAPASFLVFTFLGLGLAFPYLVLSWTPGFLRFVPRPGPWMVPFKRFLGLLLLGSVIWLLWVFEKQAGPEALLLALGGLGVLGLGAWAWGRWSQTESSGDRALGALSGFFAVAVGVLWILWSQAYPAGLSGKAGMEWAPFSVGYVRTLREKGEPFFLNFTASWCLTCQVNDRVVFRSKEVIEKFEELGIVGVKADWTSYDEAITRALEGFGRSGVPLYVLYGRGPQAGPQILPEILTPGVLIDYLEKVVS